MAARVTREPGEDDEGPRVVPVGPDTYGRDLVEWLGDDEPSDDGSEWLVRGLIASGVPNIVAGEPKSRKSLLALHVAVCVAAGIPVLGKFQTRRSRVLFIEREDPDREARRRVWRTARGLDVDPASIRDHLRVDVDKRFRFDDAESIERLRRTLRLWQAEMVILDSFRRVHGRDENSASDMAGVTAAWADLCKEFGCAIVPIHHTRKVGATGTDDAGSASRIRGTGDILAIVRMALTVDAKKVNGRLVITIEPTGNLDGLPEKFSVTVDDGTVDAAGRKTIEFRYLGDATSAQDDMFDAAVLAAIRSASLSSRELRAAVKGKGSDVDAAARRLQRAGIITRLNNQTPWRLVANEGGVP